MIADFKKNKNTTLKRFLLVTGGILMLSFLILLVVANVRIYQKREKFISQIEKLKNKIQNMQNKNSDLKKGISQINNDEYIEKIAREELSLQKPGEKVISFIKEPSQQNEDSQGQKNFLQNWLGWLSNGWQWIKDKF